MPNQKLKAFLDQSGVRYITITHSRAFTAPEVAASAHVKGRELAKTVMVRLDGRMAMAVVSANDHVDVEALRRASGARRVDIASERDFRDMFPECDVGAMPPFGNLWGLEVFADERLADDEDIAFNAGLHTELIRMRWTDFEHLVKPKRLELSSA
ncbi:MAG: YbaK/EbsC family protein [bacterium]